MKARSFIQPVSYRIYRHGRPISYRIYRRREVVSRIYRNPASHFQDLPDSGKPLAGFPGIREPTLQSFPDPGKVSRFEAPWCVVYTR